MSETLNVKKREKLGTRASDRLRSEGLCPAVLYGHNEPSVSLAVPYEELSTTLRHGAKIVQLAGDEKGQALLQDLQWDTFGRYVLHADLLRVAAGERVHVEIPVEAKGQAPGEDEGGMMTWVNHSVEIEVTPANVPEKLHIDLANVHLGDTVTASAVIDLPEGAKLLTDADRVLLNCVAPLAEEPEEEEALGTTGAEPELVGQKPEDEESSEE
ncbi:50S ribosomal protein L25 [Aeoliella sp. ICT_H6.2]|uniref:Large ribosomal subunit protein bL25 n=1 Tax=Aeoliella straminimaris TaxID=2954799 RepID=A0A9X2FGL8_9BACT|nr:50S ribosomal protein L25 [Aeoliella straminimaris]MCO6043921.1 50S ribosomal protein L25 [Aeoliella straminimaris]